MEKTVLTQEGLDNLKEELHRRITHDRADIADKIKEARAFGDLSENAEYDAAQEALAQNEARIKYLEELIKTATVLSKSEIDASVISVGSTVTIADAEYPDDEETYTLVGRTEADPDLHRISDQSPVGKALIGKREGDTILVEAPGGEFEYKILKVVR